MVNLVTPFFQRKRFLQPRRPWNVWQTVRRYQLPELLVLCGAIGLVWLGAHVDNQRGPWATPDRADVESASVELTIEFPDGFEQQRPL